MIRQIFLFCCLGCGKVVCGVDLFSFVMVMKDVREGVLSS